MTVDSDRIAISHELANIAERFLIESGMWSLTDARHECARIARHLSQLSRAVLTDSDLEVATAYAEASTILINNIVGTRRFFQTITTEPTTVRHG